MAGRRAALSLSVLVLALAAPAPAAAEPCRDFAAYAAALSQAVRADGNVDYSALVAAPANLRRATAGWAACSGSTLAALPATAQIAFWINAYNGLTLQIVVERWPIEPSLFGRLRFPTPSIRQIAGVWDEIRFTVAGRNLTLDQIEHEVLRPNFAEPRVHVALNCASRSCPPLRAEPYRGAALDRQLDTQARRFLAQSHALRIDRAAGRVGLSRIFDWYAADFVAHVDADAVTGAKDRRDRALLAFVARYVDADTAAWLRTTPVELDFLDYDWGLNAAGARP